MTGPVLDGPATAPARSPASAGEPPRPTSRYRVLRFGGDAVSMRISPRAVAVSVGLGVVVVVAGLTALTTGDYPIPVGDVVRALLGHADGGTDFVVNSLRLPRLVTCLLVGAGLALSGSIFQSVSGNLLGSPDILGFTFGSATGALVVLLVLRGNAAQASLGAVVGGLLTGVLVYALSRRHGLPGSAWSSSGSRSARCSPRSTPI